MNGNDVGKGDSIEFVPVSAAIAVPQAEGSSAIAGKTAAGVGEALEFVPSGNGKNFEMIHEGGQSVMVVKERPDMTPDTVEALKKYPHVLEKIRKGWGSPPLFRAIVEELMVMEDDRMDKKQDNGKFGRQGFPKEVLSEMFAMMETHDRKFGLPPNVEKTIEFRSKQGFGDLRKAK